MTDVILLPGFLRNTTSYMKIFFPIFEIDTHSKIRELWRSYKFVMKWAQTGNLFEILVTELPFG
jgi:hypothetical protein